MINILSILFFVFSLGAFAQVAGHPGGGKDEAGKANICQEMANEASDLEKKFNKSWNKKYKISYDFYGLMDQIILESSIHYLDHLKKINHNLLTEKKNPICKNDLSHLHDYSLAKRPHYEEEIDLLKKIKANWGKGIMESKGNPFCLKKYEACSDRLEQLKLLILIYESSKKE